jgi:hypothetical protein
MGTIKPKVERSDFNEGSLWSLDGLSTIGNVVERRKRMQICLS